MGFFSYKCSKTNKSIPAYPHADKPTKDSEVVLLLPVTPDMDGEVVGRGGFIRGHYDGYGHVGADDIFQTLGHYMFKTKTREEAFEHFDAITKAIKMIRWDAYKGEQWDEVKTSENCEYQGFFYM